MLDYSGKGVRSGALQGGSWKRGETSFLGGSMFTLRQGEGKKKFFERGTLLGEARLLPIGL